MNEIERLWKICDAFDAQESARERASWAYWCYTRDLPPYPEEGSWKWDETEARSVKEWDNKLEMEFEKEKAMGNLIRVGVGNIAYDSNEKARWSYVPKGTFIRPIR